MCRVCGRFVRCMFDSMPSRTPRSARRVFSTNTKFPIRQHQADSKRQSFILPTIHSKPHIKCTSPIQLRSSLHTSVPRRADVETTSPMIDSNAAATFQSHASQEVLQSAVTRVPENLRTAIEVQETHGATASEKGPLVLSKSLQTLLPHLVAQKPHYITTHIHSFPYLLTEGDTLRLPFHMHGVNPGDVLRFNRATIVGSRDFTLKAGLSSSQHTAPMHVRGEAYVNKRRTGEPNYIDERLFECRMRVMGLDSSPMMVVEKKKRRIRRTRTVTSKHKYTVLKVMEVRIKSLEELMSAPGQQVLLE